MAKHQGFFFGGGEWVSPNGYDFSNPEYDLGTAPTINPPRNMAPAPQVIFRDNLVLPQENIAIPDLVFPMAQEGLPEPQLNPLAQFEPDVGARFDPQPGGIIDPDPNFEGIPGWFFEGGNDFADLPGLDNIAVEPDPGIDIGDGFRINLDPVYDNNGIGLPDYDFPQPDAGWGPNDLEADWDFANEVEDWN